MQGFNIHRWIDENKILFNIYIYVNIEKITAIFLLKAFFQSHQDQLTFPLIFLLFYLTLPAKFHLTIYDQFWCQN